MIRKLRVKLVCILMALLTVMLGVTFGLVLHFTQQSLEAESLRTLEALANNWQTASSPGLDDGTRVPYFALEINARGDIITTRAISAAAGSRKAQPVRLRRRSPFSRDGPNRALVGGAADPGPGAVVTDKGVPSYAGIRGGTLPRPHCRR